MNLFKPELFFDLTLYTFIAITVLINLLAITTKNETLEYRFN
jgi:hypothetical protein